MAVLTGHIPNTLFSRCSKLPVVLHFQYYLPLVPSLATSVCFYHGMHPSHYYQCGVFKRRVCFISWSFAMLCLNKTDLFTLCYLSLSFLCVFGPLVFVSSAANVLLTLSVEIYLKIKVCKDLQVSLKVYCKSDLSGSHHCYLFCMCAYFVLQS